VASKLDLHRRHKLFLIFALVTFLGAGTGSWFVWKQCQEFDDQAASLASQTAAAKQKINTIDDLENDVVVLRENVEGYVKILPSDAEVNNFYRTLDEFRRDSGVNMGDVKPVQNRGKLSSSALFDKIEYKITFTATFQQFLQFVAKLENHARFVTIGSVKMKAGEPPEKGPKAERAAKNREVVHDVELTLVTYVYLGSDVGKTVAIPGYEHKKEKLAVQIDEARQELALEHTQLISDSVRRDPFVDPRSRRGKDLGGAGVEDARTTMNKIVDDMEQCNGLLDQEAKASNVIHQLELHVQATHLLAAIQAKIDAVTGRGVLIDSAFKRDWDKKVVGDFTKLRARVGEDPANGGKAGSSARLRLQQSLVAMQQHFEGGDYTSCVKDYELVHSVVASDGADPELVQLQDKMEGLYLAAQTAVEFSKKKLVVSGLVVEPGAESIAIVNHGVYRVGEAIEDDLVLTEIHEDHLVFEFKGVSLTFDL
jgi:Tfp pilus assembly protein PilO